MVNLSLGILDRPFVSMLSPLARLLDWLAWKYQVLFVVSAGNHTGTVDMGVRWAELERLTPSEISSAILRALAADTRNRRVLSPAESINSLTVAALHSDGDPTAPGDANRLDPVPAGYPSPVNGHGLGYRRSIKPDLLVAGGRVQFSRPLVAQETRLGPTRVSAAPGLRAASPGPTRGDLGATIRCHGTSNAAAMVSRSAAFLVPAISELRASPGGEVLGGISDGLILKALLAHGARWGTLGQDLRQLFETPQNRDRLSEQLTRFLGYGPIQVSDVSEGTPSRVTALSFGELRVDGGAEHRLPLPTSLSGLLGLRRLVVTLAWFSPISSRSHRWRQAALWFETPRSRLRIDRVGPEWHSAQRGTLQHEIFEGDSAAALVDGDDVVVRVSCRQDAPRLSSSVPYVLATTLDVDQALGIDVYSEVRAAILERVRVRPTPLRAQ